MTGAVRRASVAAMTQRHAIGGRAAWRGAELARSGAWVRRLTPAQVATLDAAFAGVRDRAPTVIRHEDFPLPGLEALIADLQDELENGLGLVRLAGLPAARYAEADLQRLFWGFGTHLGTALRQNVTGEFIGEVRDESALAARTYVETAPGKVMSSRARTRTTGPLRFHTDRCDVIALLCARNGIAGGVSRLASAVAIRDEIGRRRPDLLEILYAEFCHARPEDERAGPAGPVYRLPVFAEHAGRFTTQYSRTYVEQAQEFDSVPRLTPAQIEAMDLLAAVAEELCLEAPLEPGDIQLLNNHVIYHARTAYADDRAAGRTRLLLRLWLSMPNSRTLPAGHAALWGDVAAGALRGGVRT